MVLAALGTLGVAAWISLMTARGNQIEANYETMKRRATIQSGKALARDAFYSNHLHSSTALASDAVYTIPGGTAPAAGSGVSYTPENVAEVTIKAYADVPLSKATATRNTKPGVSPFRSFTTDVEVILSDGTNTETMQFQLRNYNPVLGGELLSMHPTNDYVASNSLVEGDITIEGHAMFWDALYKDMNAGIKAEEYLLPNEINGSGSLSHTSGGSTLPLNYPIPLQTTGLAASAPAYDGQLDIVASAGNTHNDYRARAIATGQSVSLDGFVPTVVGPGPDTLADGPNDSTLEAEISSQDPDTLMTTLPANYPLSSRVLNAVADKNNPPFSEDQLFDIYRAQLPIPDDALAYLNATHPTKIGSRLPDLHEANDTAAHTDDAGKVEIYLDEATLPHLVINRAHEIVFHGQESPTEVTLAEGMNPRITAIDNNGSDSIHTIDFRGQNHRRIVLAISTEQGASSPTWGYDAEMAFSGPDPFPEWHMILELENTGALIDTSPVSSASIVGGIRGSRNINVTSGGLVLKRQYNYEGYESLLSRNAWIETYLVP